MARKVKQPQFDIRREPSGVPMTDLIEISGWLGTYRERMRLANNGDHREFANEMRHWIDPSLQRRIEFT
jgi:hypothetical protein